MAETYCGKTCAECKHKEVLSCSGCRVGPGRATGGDCRIAQCCREKGHRDCSSCGFNGTCSKLRGRDHMPEYRLKAIEAEKIVAEQIGERASVLGRWLWILFWLIIPDAVAAVLTNEIVADRIPWLLIPGHVLGAGSVVAYGIILICLTSREERYLTAGICTLVTGAIQVLMRIPPFLGDIWWMLSFSLIVVVVGPIGQYHEFTAHSDVLTGLDNQLAEKWSALWKWYIGILVAIIGSVLLLNAIAGALSVIVSAVGVAVISILKRVYLYKTAKRFRAYKTKTD